MNSTAAFGERARPRAARRGRRRCLAQGLDGVAGRERRAHALRAHRDPVSRRPVAPRARKHPERRSDPIGTLAAAGPVRWPTSPSPARCAAKTRAAANC